MNVTTTKKRLTGIKVTEISLVDRPAVRSARIAVAKAEAPVAAPARTVDALTKAVNDASMSAAALTATLEAMESPLIRLIKSDAAKAKAAPRGGRSILEDLAINLRDAEDANIPGPARLSAMDRLVAQIPVAAAAVRDLADAAQAHKDGKLLDKARAVVSASEAIAKSGDSTLLRLCRSMGR